MEHMVTAIQYCDIWFQGLAEILGLVATTTWEKRTNCGNYGTSIYG